MYADPVFSVILEWTLSLLTIFEYQQALSVHISILKFTYILVAITIGVDPLSMELIINEFSLVHVLLIGYFSSSSLLYTVDEPAFINWIVIIFKY